MGSGFPLILVGILVSLSLAPSGESPDVNDRDELNIDYKQTGVGGVQAATLRRFLFLYLLFE